MISSLATQSAGLSVAGRSSSGAPISQQMGSGQTEGAQSNSDEQGTITFKLEKTFDGKLSDGSWYKIFEISISNGHSVYLRRDMFPSPKRATKELMAYRIHAQEIIRHGPEYDLKGQVVGEKILGRFPGLEGGTPPDSVPHYTLFWTSGEDFYAMVAEHLDDVLALEKWLKVNSFKALLKD